MKILVVLLATIGFFTVTSCTQDTSANTMMHNTGTFYFGGMHMGFWISAVVIIILVIALFFNFEKRKR